MVRLWIYLEIQAIRMLREIAYSVLRKSQGGPGLLCFPNYCYGKGYGCVQFIEDFDFNFGLLSLRYTLGIHL